MKKFKMYILFSFLLVCCGGDERRDHDETMEIYTDLVEGEYDGARSTVIRSMLGEPDTVNHIGPREVWGYGPSVEDLVNQEDSGIVGVRIYFDEASKVSGVSPVRKTNAGQ